MTPNTLAALDVATARRTIERARKLAAAGLADTDALRSWLATDATHGQAIPLGATARNPVRVEHDTLGAALGLLSALADIAAVAVEASDHPATRTAPVTVEDADDTLTTADIADSPVSGEYVVRVTVDAETTVYRRTWLDAGTALTFGEGVCALAREAQRRNADKYA